jgi:hypothetical protein
MNVKYEMIWKEALAGRSKVLSWLSPGEIEESNKMHKSCK